MHQPPMVLNAVLRQVQMSEEGVPREYRNSPVPGNSLTQAHQHLRSELGKEAKTTNLLANTSGPIKGPSIQTSAVVISCCAKRAQDSTIQA